MITGFIAIVFSIFSHTTTDTTVDRKNMTGYDYHLFQGTPAWTIAQAVEKQDTAKIISLVSQNKQLLEAREPKFGETLLQIAVMTLKYNSVKTLLELGADPNSQDTYAGSSAVMDAAEILLTDSITSHGDFSYGSNPKYLKILLKYGGDANSEQKGPRPPGYNIRFTPLLKACYIGNLDYAKLLVDAGANVNYNNGVTPFFYAVISAHTSPDVVLYLIEKGADYKQPLIKNIKGQSLYITDMMRNWRYDLNSPEYVKKMQLADFLKKNGMDYRSTKIPEQFLDQYPKEYLEKY